MRIVKHKVITSRFYKVFAVNNDGTTTLIESMETSSRPKETELCKKHNVKKVVIFEVKELRKSKTYEMTEETFIANSTEITE